MKTIQNFPLKIIEGLPPIASSKDKVAIDIEMYGMQKSRLHRPHGDLAFLGASIDGTAVYYVTEPNQVQEFLNRINDAVWIFQKSDFDLRQLRRFADIPNRKKIYDTMYIEKIMYSGYYSGFSLADLCRRWLGVYMEKEAREQFETATELTEETLHYACYDVIATWHVYQKQREVISKTDLKLWKDIDRGALWCLLNMNGMMLDKDAWMSLAEKNEAIVKELQDKYPDINLGSGKQVAEKLIDDGYELPVTEKGNPKTDKKTLAKLEENEFIQDKMRFAETKKLASTYGRNIIENFLEPDGRIWSSFNLNGAATSRWSSNNPNLENIPKRRGPEYRECFIAGLGNVIVAPDYSANEPRIGAYYSQDPVLVNIFKNDLDIYIESARLMFGWELTKKDSRRSSRMKPTVLGAFYGLSAFGLEREYDIPRDEGEELLEAFFNVFQGVKEWIDKQQKKKSYVETLYGRKFWLNPYLGGGKSERNAINSPIQGSSAEMLKIAGYRIQDWYGWDSKPIVNWMHDEIVMEVPERHGKEVNEKSIEIMVQVAEETHPGIPAKVESYISDRWYERED